MAKTTVKNIAESSGIPPRLVRAVIRQLEGREDLPNVARYGADQGYAGFTQYTDTVGFFVRNRADISALAAQRAEDSGIDPVGMVSAFRCLDLPESDRLGRRAVMACLSGGPVKNRDEYTMAANALSWFALEEVASAFADFDGGGRR